jgi:diguanylate cyclase (GGDEF)-like protein
MQKNNDLVNERRFAVLVWPALALMIGAVLWAVTISRADTELARTERDASKAASSYAQAYEQYLARSVGQLDQVTMQLKHGWEQSKGSLKLEDLKAEGMFTDAAFVDVSIADRNGLIVTSTKHLAGVELVENEDEFKFHKNNISSALRIGAASRERDPTERVVQFTRRLDANDDEFDGIVILTVAASYFTSFYSANALGRDGMVALAGEGGELRAEKHGDGSQTANPSLQTRFPLFSSAAGATLVRGNDWFSDGKDRILAWHKSTAYPFTAIVGLSHREVVASADGYWLDSRNNALLGSLCLLLMAIIATALSRRAQARKRDLEEVRRAYRTATEGANDGFYMAHPMRNPSGQIVDFEIVDCNERGAFFYGLSKKDLTGTRLSAGISASFGENLIETYRSAMESGFHEEDVRMPDDHRLNISWGHRRLVRVGSGLAITLQDIGERKSHESELTRLANEDMLTGLPNRHWLIKCMPAVLAQAQENATSLALLFIDLDEFKLVNDTQGHAVGDQLLRGAASRLKSLLRPTDHVVRFGGDEFIVVLNPVETDRQIADVAQRLLAAFAVPFAIADETQAVGASVGISVFPRDGGDTETLINHGDLAMYSGKSEGKGQYRFYNRSLYDSLKTRAQFKQSLLEAIDRDQFVLYYQPRVDARTGELCSMEALLRWIHPEQGLIAPLEFIPLAESSGLILRIGEMVMQKACAQLDAWRAQNLPLVPVSINVSPKQFKQGNIHRQLAAQLEKYRIAPNLLEVEITESAMMGDQPEIIAELSAIRDLGIKLHVDDFGTGYSSLSQLQKLRMDVLKVDQAFTSELGNSKQGKVFFQAIVSMAHALGMSVVAEGVETLQQLRILQALSCNEVQGYFIARPMPPQDMVRLMERRFLFPAACSTIRAA